MARAALLAVEDLHVRFWTRRGTVHAVNGITFDIAPGETLGIVGESGCGKSVTSLAILGLLARNGRVESGAARLYGTDLIRQNDRALRRIRGREIAMIFQDPMTSLNPVLTIGRQIREALETHFDMDRKAAEARASELLDRVGIPSANQRLRDYPHQFSGGMRQRAMIAMALSCNPDILIADEPTTALDVTIQAQILELLGELKEKFGMAVMLITHAMGVVAETAQRVVVMYAGKVVEEAAVGDLFAAPLHPYTQGLIRSIPRVDTAAIERKRLEAIAGVVPSLLDPPPGCRFAPRCRFARAICTVETPPLREVRPGHKVACVLY